MYSRSIRNGKRDGKIPEKMPVYQLPPNYRGMLDEVFVPSENNAEGIDRLVREDESYKQNEMRIRKAELASKAHVKNEENAKKESDGLYNLIDGLSNGSFLPDDVLICAMIIMMLNGKSEDDVLMVLVLMMLL
jgi:hypothetical protein